MPPTPCSFNKSEVSLVSVKGVAKDKYGSANAKPDLCIARMVFKGVSREINMELFSIIDTRTQRHEKEREKITVSDLYMSLYVTEIYINLTFII